jgi:hypothetical protein
VVSTIHFACQTCGKAFERPVDAAGSLVFCECGAANRVPWQSEAAPPPAEIPRVLPVPKLVPIDESGPEATYPRSSSEAWDVRHRDPAHCLNHPYQATVHTCAACGEGFCADCVVTLQGETLCGPCKNFRIRRLNQPARLAVLAILSPIIALIAGPVFVFILLACIGVEASTPTVFAVGFVGLGVQVLALVFGIVSLRSAEADARIGGRSLAMCGLVSAVVFPVLMIEMILLTLRARG